MGGGRAGVSVERFRRLDHHVRATKLANISADEAAYYAAQPLWFAVVTDIATIGAAIAGIALLFRSRVAVWLFAASLVCIAITHIYDFAMGTSRAFSSTGALVVTVLIAVIAVLELVYARAMRKRGVLN